MTAPEPQREFTHEICQLDQTLDLLGERLQRVLTALALTLDARRAVAERLGPAHVGAKALDVAALEQTARRCREVVKLLAAT